MTYPQSMNSEFLLIGSPKLPISHTGQEGGISNDARCWQAYFEGGKTTQLKEIVDGFAVAVRGTEGKAYMAVDRFAIRSLCYRVKNGELMFAERADQLADADSQIDPQAIYDYLYFHVIPSPRTIYKDVFRLPPGHYATFENGNLTVQAYWTPEFEEPRSGNFSRLKEEFRGLLETAVDRQLGSGRGACFLSGGTDSSTVAGMIGAVRNEPAATYSIGFEAEGYDEMEYARIAARHFKTDHHEYYVTPEDLVASIPLVAGHYDQPFGNSSALPAYYCAKMARENGVSRLLAGDGGDELFGGNTRYAKQKVFGFYQGVPSPLRSVVLEPLLLKTPLGSLPLARKGASYIRQANVPMPGRSQTYNLLYRLGIDRIFTEHFLGAVDQGAPDEQQMQVWNQARTDSQLNRELAFDWRYTLAECDLPKVVGTTSLANVDVGFPMLDPGLVDFSMRLPVQYKLNGLKLRWFFKEALRGFLPDEIITKKKQGFGLPFGVWTARHAELRKLAETSVRGLVDRGILKASFVDALFGQHLFEHPGYYGEMIWIAMMLEQWLGKHASTYSLR